MRQQKLGEWWRRGVVRIAVLAVLVLGFAAALILESMVQAFRHVAFVVPASLGVQETVLVVFGHTLGVGAETAIAVSLVKRLREVVYGIASLASWQWMEGRRLRTPAQNES